MNMALVYLIGPWEKIFILWQWHISLLEIGNKITLPNLTLRNYFIIPCPIPVPALGKQKYVLSTDTAI